MKRLWPAAFLVLTSLASSCSADPATDHPVGQRSTTLPKSQSETQLADVVHAYFKRLSDNDPTAACKLIAVETVQKFLLAHGESCPSYHERLINSWGPQTRKLVGTIRVAGATLDNQIEGSWTALDESNPLELSEPESAVRADLGEEFKSFDAREVFRKLSKDPGFSKFANLALESPATYSLLRYVGALPLSAEIVNDEEGDIKADGPVDDSTTLIWRITTFAHDG